MMGLYRDRTGGNRWLNLSRLRLQFAGVRPGDDRLCIGVLTTMAELRNSPLLHAVCPLIRQAAVAVGAAQIQNRATVEGNIVNSSPAGDTLPVWLALDAELELLSTCGCRCVRYDRFMTGYSPHGAGIRLPSSRGA
jgi:CO/xanthine dehydrogenase FAD-binding subunit